MLKAPFKRATKEAKLDSMSINHRQHWAYSSRSAVTKLCADEAAIEWMINNEYPLLIIF
jgi:hypothetical protein